MSNIYLAREWEHVISKYHSLNDRHKMRQVVSPCSVHKMWSLLYVILTALERLVEIDHNSIMFHFRMQTTKRMRVFWQFLHENDDKNAQHSICSTIMTFRATPPPPPHKHEILAKHFFDIWPSSTTLAQQKNNIGSMYHVSGVLVVKYFDLLMASSHLHAVQRGNLFLISLI